MIRWWRSHNVRVRLTVWYVVAMLVVLGVYTTAVVAFLSRKHPLRDGLTRLKARDILLTLLGPHVFFVLTTELGWSEREFGRWVTAAILRELFGIESDAAVQPRPRERAARR